jgi:hypothetical protein
MVPLAGSGSVVRPALGLQQPALLGVALPRRGLCAKSRIVTRREAANGVSDAQPARVYLPTLSSLSAVIDIDVGSKRHAHNCRRDPPAAASGAERGRAHGSNAVRPAPSPRSPRSRSTRSSPGGLPW